MMVMLGDGCSSMLAWTRSKLTVLGEFGLELVLVYIMHTANYDHRILLWTESWCDKDCGTELRLFKTFSISLTYWSHYEQTFKKCYEHLSREC